MASKKIRESKLNENQEKFCQYYITKEFFCNGVESYSAAYNIKLTAESYNTCKVNASKLLTDTNILARIREILDLSGLNDEFVDRERLFVISQNADLHAKMKAIDSYDKLKNRIIEKLEIKGEFNISLKLE